MENDLLVHVMGARALSAPCIYSNSTWYQVRKITRRAFSQTMRWGYSSTYCLKSSITVSYPEHSTIPHRQFGGRFAYLGPKSFLPGLVLSVKVFRVARRRVLAADPITNHSEIKGVSSIKNVRSDGVRLKYHSIELRNASLKPHRHTSRFQG